MILILAVAGSLFFIVCLWLDARPKQRVEVVRLPLTDEEWEAIFHAAESCGMSVETFVRSSLVEDATVSLLKSERAARAKDARG